MARSERPVEHDHDHSTLLRAAGLRVTPVRLGVLRTLCATHEVMSADQVVDAIAAARRGRNRGQKPDRVTVYRTLNALVEAGIAHKMDPGDRVFRFGLSGDHATHAPRKSRECGCAESENCPHPPAIAPIPESGHAHPHFVCDSCGKVECLEGTEVVLKPAPSKDLSTHAPKTIRQQEVVLRGTCGECDDPPPDARRKA